jgi:hypothetical protein
VLVPDARRCLGLSRLGQCVGRSARFTFAKEFGGVCFQGMSESRNVLGILVLEVGDLMLGFGTVETLFRPFGELFGRALNRCFCCAHLIVLLGLKNNAGRR